MNAGEPAPGSAPRGETAGPERYHILEGRRGGMGVVYLCRDRETGEPVALKTYLPQYLNQPGARASFLREARNWINLGPHPHIVRAHRVEQLGQPPQPFVVLDLVVAPDHAGGDPSLAVRLRKGRPLPFGRALRHALEIARGMDHAQNRVPGMVHRDLKPGNILIGRDSVARVSDFGLARSYLGIDPDEWRAARKHLSERHILAAGTAPYCAPEQWDIAAVLDARADIYALGCICIEMLTGLPAARGHEPGELREIHLEGRLTPIPGELPASIAAFLRRCTTIDPRERYQDWMELEQATARIYEEVTGTPAPPRPEVVPAADTTDHGPTYRALGRSYLDLGQCQTAVDCFSQAVELARQNGQPKNQAAALHDLGLATAQLGQLPESLALLQRALKQARQADDGLLQADALSTLGSLRARNGEGARAIRALKAAIRYAQRAENPGARLTALGNLANTYAETGYLRRAIDSFEQLLARLGESSDKDPVAEQRAAANLGAALVEAGECTKAVRHLENAIALAKAHGDIPGQLHALSNLCEALASLGDHDRLETWSGRYLAFAGECGDTESIKHARELARRADPETEVDNPPAAGHTD